MRNERGTALVLVVILVAVVAAIALTSAVTVRQLKDYVSSVESKHEARLEKDAPRERQ